MCFIEDLKVCLQEPSQETYFVDLFRSLASLVGLEFRYVLSAHIRHGLMYPQNLIFLKISNFYRRPVLAFGYCRCLCLSVCPSVRVCGNHLLVHATAHHPFKLGSPNLDHRCKRPWLRSLLFLGPGFSNSKIPTQLAAILVVNGSRRFRNLLTLPILHKLT